MDGRGGRRTDWRTHGLSVQGYRHQRNGVPCQDAWQKAVTGPPNAPVTVLAVADGAGSRPRSDQGAKLAVELATAYFGRRAAGQSPDPDGVHKSLVGAFLEVRKEFLRQTGDKADDFASTLTVVVLAPAWLGYLTVGDGFVVLRAGTEEGERQFHLLPQADAVSEYSNETVFLTSSDAERRVRTECVRDSGIDGVLLSTDGLTQAALSWSDGRPQRPNPSFASALFRSLDNPKWNQHDDDESLAVLLNSDRLSALNADDKTLLRAVRT
jgi:hypothetical protein